MLHNPSGPDHGVPDLVGGQPRVSKEVRKGLLVKSASHLRGGEARGYFRIQLGEDFLAACQQLSPCLGKARHAFRAISRKELNKGPQARNPQGVLLLAGSPH
eukprot:GHVN01054287.1.p2 GENE.GHVN01054287.1~~GHVN01054287.1.p2  ORF type:complete len:115 (-),score=3.85 GHVN01054287.1:65-370(-)